MKKHKKITRLERDEIEILLSRGYKQLEIARVLKRAKSSISEEIKRNSVNGEYLGNKAHHKAYVRKKYSRFEWKKINENTELKVFIVKCLKKHWNPAEISGYMKREKLSFYVSKTTIYEWLYSTQGIPYCQYLYSKRYTKKKRVKETKRVMIPNRVGIERRYRSANHRRVYGHLEADTVVSGKHGKGALLIAVDRKSRYVEIKKLESMKPNETRDMLKGIIEKTKVKSITFDNGIENRYHQELGIPTYFCDPYSSWQKGSVENANKMIRRYIPKGTNISKVTEEYIRQIQDTINKKPREILGYQSAHDIMLKRRLINSQCSD